MRKMEKSTLWVLMIAGVLFGLAGLREAFLPGFQIIKPEHVDPHVMAVDFTAAAMFFLFAVVQAFRYRKAMGRED